MPWHFGVLECFLLPAPERSFVDPAANFPFRPILHKTTYRFFDKARKSNEKAAL